MATLVCFHAHPDDEAIATGGVMAKAAADGHDVVLVVATRGEHGEPQPGVLGDDEPLWERRVQETHASAEVLGAGRVDFLGYRDSGMMGEPTNDDPTCLWQADVDEAAARLATILREVGADVVTIYDHNGNYGHPDHIQVHRVGAKACQLAGVDQVYEATMNRDHVQRGMAQMMESVDGVDLPDTPSEPDFGMPEADITHAVDVSAYVEHKRRAMQAHASQIGPDAFFLQLPDEAFTFAFGTEWFIRHGHTRPEGEPFATTLFGD
jgi:LmbE family N-acetylglucosaminyl deacetylase